jgi:uncharacterized protein (TIGR03067 family)
VPTDPTRIQAVFLAAAEIRDLAERAAFLAGACDGDLSLRARVEVLLRAHDQPDSLLDHPAVAPPGHGTDAYDPAAAAADGEIPLGFLEPPTRPDSLGRIGHYEVLQVLGQGGFGIVFRAFDDLLHRVVAVKVLSPQMAATSPARKRFLREARSSAAVQHENVVRVHAVSRDDEPLPYLVMEFIPGQTLQARLDQTGPLDLAEVVRLGRQVAQGLAAAHEQGLIHRDIKPSNILVDAGTPPQAKITDFGLARAADDASLTRSGTVAGTPLYMAPEQARGETLDHRADLFSLGSVLYVMLTGRPPFRAETALAVLKRVSEDTPRPIREVIPEVPRWICRIVEKLHAKDPADRYQTAREVAEVLADCEAQLAPHKDLKDLSLIPAAKRKPAKQVGLGTWSTLGVVAAGALMIVLVLFGRSAWLYASNRGELNLVPHEGLVSLIVLQNEEGVFDDNKPHPVVTDWQDMKTAHKLRLPAGKYQINAGLWPAGSKVLHWEVTTSDRFGSETRRLPGLTTEGMSVIIAVERGQRVSVRAVVKAPDVPLGSDWIQGKWVVTHFVYPGGELKELIPNFADITFAGGKVVLDVSADNVGEGTFFINETKTPREVDITLNSGKGRKLGIYRIERDKMTLCLGEAGAPRPTKFECGDTATAFLLKRAAPVEKE